MARSLVMTATRRGHRITLVKRYLPAGVSKCTRASLIRPLGQGGGPARPAECTARPSAHAVRTVSVAKTAVSHSRPEERSSVAASRLKRRVSLLRGWAGKCNR